MHYCIRNRPQKLSLKQLRFAIRFYSDLLFSKRLKKGLSIAVIFFDDLMSKEGMSGRCDPDPDFAKPDKLPRDFAIQIDPKQSVRGILRTLAHELVHVKQMAQGRLKEYAGSTSFRWENKVFELDNENDKKYFFSPWEVEAFGLEEGLYLMMMAHWNGRDK